MHSFIGIDLGGTKLAGAIVDDQGRLDYKTKLSVQGDEGVQVAEKIYELIQLLIDKSFTAHHSIVGGIGISIPGIAYRSGEVWAPNIEGWDKFPLKSYLTDRLGTNTPIEIESDRSCHLMGEIWQGAAKGCSNAIFLTIGTGIGAGILVDGRILRGQDDIGGAIGWMALNQDYKPIYKERGCFESHASGFGLAYQANEKQKLNPGSLKSKPASYTTKEVFTAWASRDPLAMEVLDEAIQYWGMACANLVSIFNPEKIIFGGGVFGPGRHFIDNIYEEAKKWAQPISIQQVQFLNSQLGDEAGLIGAAYFADKTRKPGDETS